MGFSDAVKNLGLNFEGGRGAEVSGRGGGVRLGFKSKTGTELST